MTYQRLPAEQIEQLATAYFQRRQSHSTPQERPVIVLIGGQPGAGKGSVANRLRAELRSRGGFVHIDADRMREQIPLRGEHPSSQETQADAGALATALRAKATAERRNILEEGTFRDPAAAQRFVDERHRQGYDVELVAVATGREESLAGIHARFELQHEKGAANPRFVAREYHDQALAGFDRTVELVGGQLHRLRVVSRQSELVYDSLAPEYGTESPIEALRRGRELSPERRADVLAVWNDVAGKAEARGAKPTYLQAVREQQAEAATAASPARATGSTLSLPTSAPTPRHHISNALEELPQHLQALTRDARYAQHTSEERIAVAFYKGVRASSAREANKLFDAQAFDAQFASRTAAARVPLPLALRPAVDRALAGMAEAQPTPARSKGPDRSL